MSLASRLRAGLRIIDWPALRAAPGRCPFCGPTLFLRLNAGEGGLRCARCTASTVHLSLGLAIRQQLPDIARLDVCELAARGPLARWLARRARSYSGSEYFPGVAKGSMHQGLRCEDVQQLSYASRSFDLVVHTEVMEHVPDDGRGFAELCRVLRPGGCTLFTVPLTGLPETLERARLQPDGSIEHLAEPCYHVDPNQGGAGILAFRDYGNDILERLQVAGFTHTAILTTPHRIPWLDARKVVLARRS